MIRASSLSKEFRVAVHREGVAGALKNLVRREHRTVRAVDGVSFRIAPGEMVGLLGPNGAGKSTTIKMLTGILVPTSGEVEVGGFVPWRDRRRYVASIGAVFGQRTALWWDLAAVESLRLHADLYGVTPAEYRSRLAALDAALGLAALLGTPVRKLSLGERMRCELAAALLHEPKVLFLDEPTIGLDVVAKAAVRGFLKDANRRLGTTMILTTHDMADVEDLCQRVLVVDRGRLLFDGALAELARRHGTEARLVADFARPVAGADLEAAAPGVRWEAEGPLRWRGAVQRDRAVAVTKGLLDRFEIADLSVAPAPIEEVVRRLYGEGAARA